MRRLAVTVSLQPMILQAGQSDVRRHGWAGCDPHADRCHDGDCQGRDHPAIGHDDRYRRAQRLDGDKRRLAPLIAQLYRCEANIRFLLPHRLPRAAAKRGPNEHTRNLWRD